MSVVLLASTTRLFFLVSHRSSISFLDLSMEWAVRTIVEKRGQYDFHRPASEAIASMVLDIPNEILLTLLLDVFSF